MAAWYSKRKKSTLAYKFKAEPKGNPFQQKVFGNYSDIFGHCHNTPARYVYNRYDMKRLKALHGLLSIDSHPELNGGKFPPFDEWVYDFIKETEADEDKSINGPFDSLDDVFLSLDK